MACARRVRRGVVRVGVGVGGRMTHSASLGAQTLSKNNVLSVYVSIGQRCSNVARIHRLFSDYDALRYTTIVAATAADPGLPACPLL